MRVASGQISLCVGKTSLGEGKGVGEAPALTRLEAPALITINSVRI